MFNNSLRVSLDFEIYFIVKTYRVLNFEIPETLQRNALFIHNFSSYEG